MTITATGAVVPPAEPLPPARRPVAGDSGFSVPGSVVANKEAEASVMRGIPVAIDAASILALQEDRGAAGGSDGGAPDREARRHGQDLLQALADLQKALLAGGDPALSLARLSALADATPSADDPALAHILGTIRLRARLEILRLSRGFAPSGPVPGPAGAAVSVTGS